ncbi:MAG: MOSC domain-containing protein [Maricaulaceae bacterium]
MSGRLIGIARRAARKAPMERLEQAQADVDTGLEGDAKGTKTTRQVSILAREDWEAALADLALAPDALDWTVRRANFLVEGVRLPRAVGGLIAIGPVRIEVRAQTSPCKRMEVAQPGLLKALSPYWRGGVLGKVIDAGPVALGDPVEILRSPPETIRRLP